jgi:hypothetical protein
MKKCIITILVFSFSVFSLLHAQEKNNHQEVIASYQISDGSSNGEDITSILLEQNAYLVVYKDSITQRIYLANFWEKNDSQSYGEMYSVEQESYEATDESYAADVFTFQWRYINSYDDKKGTANVKLVKVYKPQGVYFIMTIIPEYLDILVYKGYMNGTLNLTVHEKKI